MYVCISSTASGYDSGDSYDSGGEVERNADDDKFIDRDGDDDSDLEGYGGKNNETNLARILFNIIYCHMR